VSFRGTTRLRHALAVCVGLAVARALFAATVPEHELKAALTYKVAKFVTWPAEREAAATFNLCVLGQHPFESALDDAEDLKIKVRAIVVRQLSSAAEETKTCDLLFIADSESDRLLELLAELADEPVLTVSDMARFARRGGMVELQSRDNRVGFEINVMAYRRAGLVVSSQLLQLATLLNDATDTVL
jgi:hypothetical protein